MEGHLVINFEGASSNSFRYIPQNHLVTAAEAAADIDVIIRRKRPAFVSVHWRTTPLQLAVFR